MYLAQIWFIFKLIKTVKKYSSEHGYLAPANGPGAPGQFTKRPGILAFYEICDVTNKWYLRVVRDHESKEMFPYSVKNKISRDIYWKHKKVPYAVGTLDEYPYDSQWIGFDNEQSVAYKVELAKHYGLGGISFFSLDGDDFTGRFCNGGQWVKNQTLSLSLLKLNKNFLSI